MQHPCCLQQRGADEHTPQLSSGLSLPILHTASPVASSMYPALSMGTVRLAQAQMGGCYNPICQLVALLKSDFQVSLFTFISVAGMSNPQMTELLTHPPFLQRAALILCQGLQEHSSPDCSDIIPRIFLHQRCSSLNVKPARALCSVLSQMTFHSWQLRHEEFLLTLPMREQALSRGL